MAIGAVRVITDGDPVADAPPDAIAAAGESTSAMKVAKAFPVPPADAVAVGGVMDTLPGVALALALPVAVALGGVNVTLSSDPDALPAAPPDAVAVGPAMLTDTSEPLAAALPAPVAVGVVMVIALKLPDALPAPPAPGTAKKRLLPSGWNTCHGFSDRLLCSAGVRYPSKIRTGPIMPSKLRAESDTRLPHDIAMEVFAVNAEPAAALMVMADCATPSISTSGSVFVG